MYSFTGMRRDTYLEFNRRLKIKRRSDFTIDFKTTEQDGVIFYTADERDIDFIALFLKGGQVRNLECITSSQVLHGFATDSVRIQ